MRHLFAALTVASSMMFAAASTQAQVSININAGGVSIGVNMPTYPDLVQIPGYPVYYDPQADSNYFFYDGLYWVFDGNNWYDSTWYNGPWQAVNYQDVPLFVLRVPVRYYRQPPAFFGGWSADAPPRWGDHWGNTWESRHAGWDNWNRNAIPAIAPLPIYQRQYTGNRYPRAAQQQRTIQAQNYRYQPHEAVSRQHFQAQGKPAPARQSARTNPQQQSHPQQARTKPAPVTHTATPEEQAALRQAHQPSGAHARPAQPQHPPIQAQTRAPQGQQKAHAPERAPEHKGATEAKGGENKGHPQDKGNEKNEQHG